MGKLPSDYNESPKIGGTPNAANTSFNKGSEPDMGVESIKPFGKASGTKGAVNESVLSTKGSTVGGSLMGK